jgi:hypothetical protein
MTTLETLQGQRTLQMNEVTRLTNRGYQRRGVPQYQKAIYSKAVRAVDKTNIEIEKIEYRQSDVIKLLREAGLTASKKQSTAIRGYNTYTKGYEVDNKYSVSYIALHSVSQNEVDLIYKLAEKALLNVNVATQGISFKK